MSQLEPVLGPLRVTLVHLLLPLVVQVRARPGNKIFHCGLKCPFVGTACFSSSEDQAALLVGSNLFLNLLIIFSVLASAEADLDYMRIS